MFKVNARYVLFLLGGLVLGTGNVAMAQNQFERGDVNDDGAVDISDAVRALSYLFVDSSAEPPCHKAADVNDDSVLDISDPVNLLGFLFVGGDRPNAPFGSCGFDPTPDALSCGKNRCSSPVEILCADLAAVSIDFELANLTEFSTSVTRVVATVRNDGTVPFTSVPGSALAILTETDSEGTRTMRVVENILELAPGETMTIEYDQEFSYDLSRTVTLEVVFEVLFGDSAQHEIDCNPDNNFLGTTHAALLGDITFEGDCSPDLQKFNEDIMKYGRIAAVSRAFEECVDTKLRSTYRQCNTDPWFDQAIEVQIQKVLEVCRSVNTVNIFCSGGSGNASTGIGTFGHTGDEEFRWGGWLASVHDQLSKRTCGSGENPGDDDCRFAAYPWPYSQAAGIVWHEVMHTHGYTHGANEQDDAIVACGYSGDPSWHFQVNTMPYIIGNCISEVISLSAQRCGDIDACPGDNQLRLIDGYDSWDCECVNDPGQKGLGIIVAEGSELVDEAILPAEDWAGGWHYGTANTIEDSGDFDGNGRDDILITSSWGIGILTFDGSRWRSLVAQPNGWFGGWNFDSRVNKIVGVGDFNRDGRDDIVVTSGWGIGVLTRSGNTLTSLVVQPNGTAFGGWVFNSATDRIWLGDFNGDSVTDLLVKRNSGIGILTLAGSSFTSLVAKSSGTFFGGWNFSGSENTILGVGDFNGDGSDDILIRSALWIGTLTRSGSTLTSTVVARDGTRFIGWTFDARGDVFNGIGDMNGDGRDDIIVTSSWGIAVLVEFGTTFATIVQRANGTWFGHWNFDSTANFIVGIADVNGDGADDLLLRSGWGYGVLTRDGPTMTHIDMTRHGTLFGSWMVRETDWTVGLGNYDGRGGSDILFQAHE